MASEVTLLLNALREGEDGAFDALAQLIYPELKAMARRRSSSTPLSATTLVHETFLKLLNGGTVNSKDRQQFFALAATIMRRVIVDEVRRATASKRSAPQTTVEEGLIADEKQLDAEFLIEVDQVLESLAEEDPRLVQVFECRYFAGFTSPETAHILSISERSAERLWSSARSRIAELMQASN